LVIRSNIETVIERINENYRSTPSEPIVRPQFFSTDFLADAPNERTGARGLSRTAAQQLIEPARQNLHSADQVS
jgi:hypothetical protein